MKDINIKSETADIVCGAIFMAIFTGAFLVSLTFESPVLSGDPGAGFFPRLISIVSLLYCAALLIQKLIKKFKSSAKETKYISVDLFHFLISFISVLLLIITMNYAGSEIAFFAFLSVLIGWRTQKWLKAVIIGVISTATVYLVFVALLNVRLPLLFLPKYLIF